MATFGSRIVEQRKEKNLNRDELGQLVGTSGAIIGRYERDDVKPSVDVAAKIAEVLGVTLDYLVNGSSVGMVKDKQTKVRLELLDKIAPAERERILYVLDSLLRDAQYQHTQKELVKS